MTVRPANCAHLHSAFGPGCPYCHPPRSERALDGPPRRRGGARPARPRTGAIRRLRGWPARLAALRPAGGARGTVADEPDTGRESQPS